MLSHMISFVMPAKNVSLYVREAIEGLTKASYRSGHGWLLIRFIQHDGLWGRLDLECIFEKGNNHYDCQVRTNEGNNNRICRWVRRESQRA